MNIHTRSWLFTMLVFSLSLFVAACNLEPIGGNDDNGNGNGSQNSKIIGGSGQDEARSIIQTSDGGFLLTGTTSSANGDFQGLAIG